MSAELTPAGRIEVMRRELPFAMQRMTQFVLDNPGQVAVGVSAYMVLLMAASNVCKPRNVLEAVAVAVAVETGYAFAAKQAIVHGWLNLNVRDEDGNLVSLKSLKAGEQ